jgi:glycosyltransferase involved in cell wall biosynthesis
MRIAWFTPLAPTSAIGRFSVIVTERLALSADVELWVEGDGPTLRTFVPVVRFDANDHGLRVRLREYDMLAFNIGNHEPFHGAILQVARREPGIVILHDVFNHHLLAGYYGQREGSAQRYVDEARRWYGAEGERFALAFLRGREAAEDYARFPLFEPLVVRHVGAITHSRWHAQAVAERCRVPAEPVFLAYQPPVMSVPPRAALGIPPAKTLMVSVGFVNANRRIDVVLRALADSELRDRVVYRILGPLGHEPYRRKLEALIQELGLGGSVSLLGYADEATLAAHLVHADICMNLRYPVTESASASVIEQALLSKAIVVTDTGFYAELPDDVVYKIPLSDEASTLRRVLRRLVDEPAERREVGERAALWVRERSTGDAYAAAFLRFARALHGDVRGTRLRAHAASVFDTMGLRYDDALPWRIAETTRELFGDELTPRGYDESTSLSASTM